MKEMKILSIGLEEYEVMDRKARPVKSVADMKAMENLKDGNVIKTLGYYESNDGGEALYLIRTKLDNDYEDKGLLHIINEDFVAELIIEKEMNVKQFGAKGDGINDDLEPIQRALNTCKNIKITNGIYLITDLLEVPSDITVELYDARIISNNTVNKKVIFNIAGKSNVNIIGYNSSLEMTKPETEQQACVHIKRSNNVNIKGLTLTKAGGDGIIVEGSTTTFSSDVVIDECVIDNNRRNGISLIGGIDGLEIKNSIIKNTSGTLPEAGIDIESWDVQLFNRNIKIDNCEFSGNDSGAIIVFENTENIKINNNTFKDNRVQVKTNPSADANETRQPKNIVVTNNKFTGTSTMYSNKIMGGMSIIGNTLEADIMISSEYEYTSYEKQQFKPTIIANNKVSVGRIQIENSGNILVVNNSVLECKTSPIYIIASHNIDVRNNMFVGYNYNNGSDKSVIQVQTSQKVLIEGNTAVMTEKSHSLPGLVYTQASCRNVIVRNNNALNTDITQVLKDDSWTSQEGIAYNNIVPANLMNDLRLPSASAFYVGVIAQEKDSNGIVRNKICSYNDSTSTYQWKTI